MHLRPFRKGETRRIWRNYWPGAAAVVLAATIVAALVLIAGGW